MFKSFYFFVPICLFASLVTLPLIAADSTIDTVPAVRQWQPLQGELDILKSQVYIATDAPEGFDQVAKLFASELSDLIKSSVQVKKRLAPKGEISLSFDKQLSTEAYKITISDKGVLIQASHRSGAYYATRTILQMLIASKGTTLPMGSIHDTPKYPVRSMLIDVGRKFIPVEGLKDWIRMLGWLKMNELHLHLNDNGWGNYPGYRLESRRFPKLPSKDGYYTWKEIRELQGFAKLHGVSIVPEIDSPGHALAFTKLRPDLAQSDMNRAGFGLAYLDLQKKETIRFMEEIFDEVAPLFDSKYIHIGTDEYRLNLVRDKTTREELGEQFRQYINHLDVYLRQKHGKTTRIWSGYEHMPGTTEPNKSVIIDMWETSDAKNKSKAGYKFVNSSHFYTYIVPGMPYYGVNNTFIYDQWTPMVFQKGKPQGELGPNDPGLLGGKLHVWNDGGPTGYTWNEIARLTYPSMLAISEKLWGTKGSENYKMFVERAQKIKALPNVQLLNRVAKANQQGVVFQHRGPDMYFIANTHHNLDLPGHPKNLEYPWVASFTVTRLSDTHGDDVLISSDLATFYLDLSHTTKDKKTKKDITKRGVGCVRAKQAPGAEPLRSARPDVIVFDYKVPLKTKVTLTFVGDERQTSLYADGKLIGTSRLQMVCPLQRLGDLQPKSFQGILHKATIVNRSTRQQIGSWNPSKVSTEFQSLEWDVTDSITPGVTITAAFQYTGGAHRLDIQWVTLLENGKEIARDQHDGITGGTSKNNLYRLKLDKAKSGAKYQLRASVRSDGGNDSNGKVYLLSLP